MKSGMDMKFDPYGALMIAAIVLIVFHLILLCSKHTRLSTILIANVESLACVNVLIQKNM